MFISMMIYQYYAQISNLEQMGLVSVKQQLTALQGELEEEFSEYGNYQHGERAVSAIGLIHEARSLAVLDKNNRILLATKYSWKRHQAKVIPGFDVDIANKIKRKQLPLVFLAKDRLSIKAYYPLKLRPSSAESLSPSNGIIFFYYDLSVVRARITNNFIVESIIFALIGLLFMGVLISFLNRLIGRPLQHMSETMRRLANGELGVQLNENSQGELGLLGAGFNKMSTQVEESIIKLRRSERNLSMTLDSIGDAVIVTNVLGRVTRVNSVSSKLTGWESEEAIGKPLSEVFNVIDSITRQPVDNSVTEVLRTESISGLSKHAVLIAKDGTEYQISDSAAPILGVSGKMGGVILVFRDVTEEYTLQATLSESELRFRNLVETSSDWIWEVDSNGRFTYVSPHCFEMLGYMPEELIGKTPFDLMPADEAERVRSLFITHTENTQTLISLENINLSKKGREVILETNSMPYFDSNHVLLGYRGVDRDITIRKKTEKALAESERRFRQLFEQIPNIAVQGYAKDGKVIFWNLASEKLYGVKKEEAVGVKINDLIIPDGMLSQVEQTIIQLIETREPIPEAELELQHKDGSTLFVCSNYIVLDNAVSDPEIYRIDIDLTETRKAQAEIEQLAYFDELTQLPNRRLFLDRLKEEMEVVQKHSVCGAILYMDLNDFKTINDSLGHSVGDIVLQQVSSRIQSQIRSEDTLSRFGGDEFVILLKDLSENPKATVNQARFVAEKIQKTFSQPIDIDEHELFITLSIGISLFSKEDENAAELLKQADTAMYRAKEMDRNAIRFFESAMQVTANARLTLEKDLRLALLRDEFFLRYQPQVNINGKIIGAEALLRWNHPKKGVVFPGEFISVAEETGIILQIGGWVLKTACEQLSLWKAGYQEQEFHIAINVSPQQFRMNDFVAQVENEIESFDIDPQRLTLEVTENIVIHNIKDTVKKMQALKKMGICFSIDDFGTGYSSLSYLKSLPLDQLKIDQSFVRDINQDPNDEAIVETIITMAHILGLHVVAEGVAKQEQVNFLTEKGCEFFQGFYFDKPLPPEIIVEKLM